jgi:LmbE family N-acetylglucosaminyl deacetylase
MRIDVSRRSISRVVFVILATLCGGEISLSAQAPSPYSPGFATTLPIDRGASAVWQSLQKLRTRASLILIVAHPDDEDGGMLAYEARDQGVDTTMLTLNRGEGGQNVMSSDYWDQLGLLRTQELLTEGDYLGVHQAFTRVADYGFSKTLDEAFKTWGHERILYDVVRQVRITRPLVVTSVWAGNVSDGHGQHQAAGVMTQEVFNAAADPKVFPDQIKAGLMPWAPLKVYARVPFAWVTDKGIYDYATGNWENPIRFKNYTNDTWIQGLPSTTVSIPEGKFNPLIGRSYLALASEGLAQQKSQYGGTAIPTPYPYASPYHLYATRATATAPAHEDSFFDGIDTTLPAIADYAPPDERGLWRGKLTELSSLVQRASDSFDALHPEHIAPLLAQGLGEARALLSDLAASNLPAEAKYDMTHELLLKEKQFNDALGQSLGLSILATVSVGAERASLAGNPTSQPSPQTIIPGQRFDVNLHIADQSSEPVTITSTGLESHAGTGWVFTSATTVKGRLDAENAEDQVFSVAVPLDAEITKPYFTRSSLEQPYYDINTPKHLGLPTTPYPLTAEVRYIYGGVEAELRGTVQTIHAYVGPGPLPEPLLVAPAISVTITPQAGVIPLTNTSLQLEVTVRSSVKGPASGQVHLELPKGWSSRPKVAQFAVDNAGEQESICFEVTPVSVEAKPYEITAIAEYDGKNFREGFINTGYPGGRPYPSYRRAIYRTSGVNVKIVPGLKVAYVNGSGDEVANSLKNLGVNVTFLSAQDITSGDLSGFDAVILGIRAYAARPELKTSNNRILDYVHNGGTVIVQYQSPEYDHNYGPYPLSISNDPATVVDENSSVKLAAADPILNFPNKITEEDFKDWIEERGHGFAKTWSAEYKAPTEVHDPDQSPQYGGLLYAPYGKGTYIYLSYAFFRQMPEGVPGSFRIMANLLSISRHSALQRSAGE